MPVLHLAIENARQTINLPSDLTAQDLTLVESAITFYHDTAGGHTGVKIELPFISPLDYVSSQDSRYIYFNRNLNDGIHTAGDAVVLNHRHNLHFATEHIPNTFTVRTKNILNNENATFGFTAGDILRIDLFFHYNHLERHI